MDVQSEIGLGLGLIFASVMVRLSVEWHLE